MSIRETRCDADLSRLGCGEKTKIYEWMDREISQTNELMQSAVAEDISTRLTVE